MKLHYGTSMFVLLYAFSILHPVSLMMSGKRSRESSSSNTAEEGRSAKKKGIDLNSSPPQSTSASSKSRSPSPPPPQQQFDQNLPSIEVNFDLSTNKEIVDLMKKNNYKKAIGDNEAPRLKESKKSQFCDDLWKAFNVLQLQGNSVFFEGTIENDAFMSEAYALVYIKELAGGKYAIMNCNFSIKGNGTTLPKQAYKVYVPIPDQPQNSQAIFELPVLGCYYLNDITCKGLARAYITNIMSYLQLQ